MSRERNKTRDLLLEYDPQVMSYHYRAAGLSMIYPWENTSRAILTNEIYQIVVNNGFTGTEEEFWNFFSSGTIINGKLESFPIPGSEKNLYIDTDTGIVYYFKTFKETILPENAAIIGAAIVGKAIVAETREEITYVYIPIRAKLIENTLINGGEA